MMSRLLLLVWLSVVWIALWGEVSVGNVVAGLLIGALLVLVFPPGKERGSGIHPIAVLRFGVWFAWAVVVSNVAVAKEVLRPRQRLEEGIVAVPLRATSPIVTAFVANAITLTPGTMTVDVRPRSFGTIGTDDSAEDLPRRNGAVVAPVLYVHCLVTGDPDKVRADGAALEELAVKAFGTSADREAIGART